jgi:aspartate racemase
MHKIADNIQRSIGIPAIHIAEVASDAVAKQQIGKVALLGTRYTMLLDFYREKLDRRDIATIIPRADDIEYLNHIIYNVMGKGIFTDEIKKRVLSIIDELVQEGAEGVILACTELPILIKQEDCTVPVFDTTALHVKAAVEFALP